MKTTRVRYIICLVVALLFASCGNKEITETAKPNASDFPCLDYYDDSGFIRELGISYYDTDSVTSLENAKLTAYYNMLFRALTDLYPNISRFYDESMMEDDNIACAKTIKNKDGLYESFVVIEAPRKVLYKTLESAIKKRDTITITTINGVEIFPRISDSIKKYIRDEELQDEYTRIMFEKYYIEEYKTDTTKVQKLSDDEKMKMGTWDEKRFEEEMEKALKKYYEEKSQEQDSIKN